MQLDYRTKRGLPRQPQKAVVTRTFQKLQKTEVDQDKSAFDSFWYVKNMIHKGLNAVLRRGTSTLATVDSLLGFGFHERDDENALMGIVDTSSTSPNTSKLIEINRTTGATTDKITAIVGDSTPTFSSLRQYLYVTNSEDDIRILNSAGTEETQIALPSSGIAKLACSDTERLWVAQTDGIIRTSVINSTKLATADFVVSGTLISRAVLIQSQISDVKSLKGNGKTVCIAGSGRIELHATPNFAQNGITTYPEDVQTLLVAYENLGVTNNDAVIPYSNGFFVKPKDGVLYFISPELTKPQEFRDNLQQMEDLDWSKVKMGFDPSRKLVYITGKDKIDYDTTICFNIQEQNFSTFTNIWSVQWISDIDNIYYRNSYDFQIREAFAEGDVTDSGSEISWEVQTAMEYGSLENYWKAMSFFANYRYWADITVLAELYTDRKIDGTKSADWSLTREFSNFSSPFSTGISGFGMGVWGGVEAGASLIHTEDGSASEYYEYNEKIFKTFNRAYLRLSGTSNNRFEIRGVGMNIEPTQRKVRNITMDS